tara:strand:+ start:209 stop:640 length:432 start_codon:yes stop_codon:yes gene_type:complete
LKIFQNKNLCNKKILFFMKFLILLLFPSFLFSMDIKLNCENIQSTHYEKGRKTVDQTRMVLIYEIDFNKNEILKYPQKFKLTPMKYKITGKSKKFIKANMKIAKLNNTYGNWNLMFNIEKGELKEIFDSGKHKSQITYRCLTY